jgi:Glycosyltransferase family 87
MQPLALGTRPVFRNRQIYLAAVCLFALAIAKLAIEDFPRLGYPVNDLTSPWISSILFMQGKNPYSDTDGYAKIWSSTHVSPLPDYRRILSVYRRIYPPTTLLLITPLGLLKWHAAVYVYLCVSLPLFVFGLWILARNLPVPAHDPRRLYFVAFALALAPLHSGIHCLNLSTLAVACICAGVGFMTTRPCVSGIALAIAVSLKPQLAILFFAYPWLRKKWKTALVALAACAMIGAISLSWMAIHHVEWFNAWRSEIRLCSIPPGGCSAYGPGFGRLQLLNLETLAFEFTRNAQLANALSWLFFIPVLAVCVVLIHLYVSPENEAVGIAIISILTLLPYYQNIYSGEILLFVLYWAIGEWSSIEARVARCLMVLLLVPPFFGLEQKIGFLVRFVRNYHLDSNPVWNGFLVLHMIWFELFFLLLLCATLYKTATAKAELRA